MASDEEPNAEPLGTTQLGTTQLGTTPLGAVLAGGLSRRMGGPDKADLVLDGRTLIERVLGRLAPQCDGLVINASDAGDGLRALGWPIVFDDLGDRPGPLAGIVAILDWAAARRITAVAVAPVDAPFLPGDLVARLVVARREAGTAIACAASGGRRHPVASLWDVALRDTLRHLLVAERMRRMERVLDRIGAVSVSWPDRPFDPFFNVNTPADLAEAGAILGAYPDSGS